MKEEFNRFILFGGIIGSVTSNSGMESSIMTALYESDVLKYIIKHKIASEGRWYQVFDCTQCKVILYDGLEEDVKSEAPRSAVDKHVDDTDFDYPDIAIESDFNWDFTNETTASFNCDIGKVKHVINKNRKQLVTVLFRIMSTDPGPDYVDFENINMNFIRQSLKTNMGIWREASEVELLEMI